MINVLGSIFLKYRFTILSFLYFGILAFWMRGGLPDSRFFFNLIYAVLNAVILQSLIILISKIPKFSWVFAFVLSLLVTADITHKLVYGTLLTLGGISSMFESNTSEARDFFLLYIKDWLPAILLTASIIMLSVHEARSITIRKKYIVSFLVIALSLNFASIFLSRGEDERATAYEEFNTAPDLFIQTSMSVRIPLGMNSFISTLSYWNEMRKFREEATLPKLLMPGLSYSQKNVSPQTIFLVIGESSLRTHYSLYGYDLPTTPFLDSLNTAGNLLYYNAFSVAPITREALRMSLSFASPLDVAPFTKNENVVTMANLAGYESHWVSNQDKVGMHDSFIGLLASYAKTSKFYHFEKDDIQLLKDVSEQYDSSKKQIFFIHLKGSHIDYSDKYDRTDQDDFKEVPGREITLDYDRSIHHTDRVLSQLDHLVKSSAKDSVSSVIVYYSDHGEVINKGHGIMKKESDQFKIPFLIIPYSQKRYISQKMEHFLDNGIFNSNSISYFMSFLLGYDIDEQLLRRSQNEALYYYHVDGRSYKIADL